MRILFRGKEKSLALQVREESDRLYLSMALSPSSSPKPGRKVPYSSAARSAPVFGLAQVKIFFTATRSDVNDAGPFLFADGVPGYNAVDLLSRIAGPQFV